ncbi:eukaryotic translation initiation factor eIF-4E [Trypanosoma grayi]|uniref:eukaryotic translation initiation factor eIF-4E n=1 Tax=Trypanosoma grayi TaxID=71804 RepID=UPI0004F41731|nr:eukaryotic translation initiation factor eIF-4E [Trypanosoma grayi]KEG11456.1 eukaryotic translation initiation factor eIF-4E [Trypanosoma grayi]
MSDAKPREAAAGAAAAKGDAAHHHHHHQQQQHDAKQAAATPGIDKGLKKHPLNRAWTLWYDSLSTYDSQQWELSLVEVMTVRTVEDFFTMLHYCKPPHVLRISAQYHFFREGVKPMWEDPSNKAGGKIWVSLDEKGGGDAGGKKWDTANATGGGGSGDAATAAAANNNAANANNNSSSGNNANHHGKAKKEEQEGEKKPELDAIWENVLMAMVGEYLDPDADGDHIMGVVLSKRKYHNRIALWLRDAGASEAVARIEKQLVREAGLPSSAKFIFTPHGGGKP